MCAHTHSETWGLENIREDTLVDALAIPESEKQGISPLPSGTGWQIKWRLTVDQLEEKMRLGCDLGLAEDMARNSYGLGRSGLERAQDFRILASCTWRMSYSRDMWWLYQLKKGKKERKRKKKKKKERKGKRK
ncbi:hypothetical protein TIFTF001_029933 [Ficus carica]|uniref:Uncharacterized protein n=1 Tax=Ficus carica TaxID=3494 RepID=A0AA88DSD1_FICCA|nr:hypothetical protein TIFTF001_029933 [Ficus carica]